MVGLDGGQADDTGCPKRKAGEKRRSDGAEASTPGCPADGGEDACDVEGLETGGEEEGVGFEEVCCP